MSPLPVSLLRCVACIVCVRDCPVGGRRWRCLPRRDDVPKIEIDLSVFRPRFHLLPHSYAQQPALHHALHAAGVSASGVGHRCGPHADHAVRLESSPRVGWRKAARIRSTTVGEDINHIYLLIFREWWRVAACTR